MCLSLVAGCSTPTIEEAEGEKMNVPAPEEKTKIDIPKEKTVNFSQYSKNFQFSAEVPPGMEIEFIQSIDSINIYDPKDGAENIRDKSKIFIRNFEANKFLTLSTVDIASKEGTFINGHAAVHYEITKKPEIKSFPEQPIWRNYKHKLTDIRLNNQNPSWFYVFSYNPNYDPKQFEKFLNSIVFHNDKKSYSCPINNPKKRVTKKPFGIKIDPKTSPIQPEKFSGFHVGTDYEILGKEADQEVSVKAICNGELALKDDIDGYGGLAIQKCKLEDQDITVLYGHLDLKNVTKNVGEQLFSGEIIGHLGAAMTEETDGERKHLHLGIHKGKEINSSGYETTESALKQWMNPEEVLKDVCK